MRGIQSRQVRAFSYVDTESMIPDGDPIRKVKAVVDEALSGMEDVFKAMYAESGRPSIPPEQLIRALVVQIVHTIRSERQLMKRIKFDLMFRWFVGLSMDDPVWHHSTFTKNRDRLLAHGIDEAFLAEVNKQAAARKLLSKDHFSLDGTLLEACASIKSFKPKDAAGDASGGDGEGGGGERDFRGEKFSNKTHRSTTDPDARLCRKGDGQAARLCHMGHALIENRSGLVVAASVSEANGTAEGAEGLKLLDSLPRRGRRRTVGCDKGYDGKAFVKGCRERRFTPHAAARKSGGAVDGRTTRHGGYRASMVKRKRVEEPFGWAKTTGLLRKLRHRGRPKAQWQFRFTAAVYNVTLMIGLAGGVA